MSGWGLSWQIQPSLSAILLCLPPPAPVFIYSTKPSWVLLYTLQWLSDGGIKRMATNMPTKRPLWKGGSFDCTVVVTLWTFGTHTSPGTHCLVKSRDSVLSLFLSLFLPWQEKYLSYLMFKLSTCPGYFPIRGDREILAQWRRVDWTHDFALPGYVPGHPCGSLEC